MPGLLRYGLAQVTEVGTVLPPLFQLPRKPNLVVPFQIWVMVWPLAKAPRTVHPLIAALPARTVTSAAGVATTAAKVAAAHNCGDRGSGRRSPEGPTVPENFR
jgi:hypothetical protein